MMKTGRDAHRKPGGFKDLEIAFRRHVRQLVDIGKALTFDEREPLDKAKDEAIDIRDDLLKALFGEQNAPISQKLVLHSPFRFFSLCRALPPLKPNISPKRKSISFAMRRNSPSGFPFISSSPKSGWHSLD